MILLPLINVDLSIINVKLNTLNADCYLEWHCEDKFWAVPQVCACSYFEIKFVHISGET